MTILILEDDESLREILAESLEDADYAVHQAGDSAKALECVARRDIALLITDIRMAGPDGLETLARALELKPCLKSIVITGYADADAPPRAIESQVSDYLRKPFGLPDLLTAVHRVLNAEQEEQRYQGLLGRMVSGYRNLKAVAADAGLKSLEKVRDQAFKAYYVGVRSRHVNEANAVSIWCHMLMLESEREKLKSGYDASLLSKLTEAYRSVTRGLAAVGQAQPSHAPAPPLLRARHMALIQGLEDGRISVEQLKLAPLLGGFRHETLRQEPELEELYRALQPA